VNILAFSILPMPGGCPRLAVFGHFGRNGHHYFTVFLLQSFDGVCIDPLEGN
jgi:hypothetical protein